MADFYVRLGDRNDVLILNEYKNEFSIISGYEGRDGNNYFNMVFPRDNKTKEPRDVVIPQKIKLGERDNAISILKQFIAALSRPQQSGNPVDDDDIPF